MATRYSRLGYNWATNPSSLVVDPDDDASHPSGEGGPGKYQKGWVVETEPHEWENYVLKRQEDLELQKLERGWEVFDVNVNYRFGAIAVYNGVPSMYINQTQFENPINNEDGVTTLYDEYATHYLQQEGISLFADVDWTPILAYTKREFDQITNNMATEYSEHLAEHLAHKETIGQIGGYTTTKIDSIVAGIQTTTDNHINNKSNPHVETVANIGTLGAVAGGNFTGRVDYTGGIAIPDGEVMYNSDKHILSRTNDSGIGIGTADYRKGGHWQTILAENTWLKFEQLYSDTFVLPPPDLQVFMKSNTYDYGNLRPVTFKRNSTLSYTNISGEVLTAPIDVPAFERDGLKLTGATSIKITAPDILGCRDCTISYVKNNVLYIEDRHFLSEELTYYFGTTGNVRNFTVWARRLTPRQKLSIRK